MNNIISSSDEDTHQNISDDDKIPVKKKKTSSIKKPTPQ